MIRVLMVCTGNICRSPMAEAIFARLVHEAGLDDQIKVDSAGTTSYHEGENAHPGTLKVLAKHGITYEGRSRPLTPYDMLDFDYIVAMDDDNLRVIKGLGTNTAQVSRLLDALPDQPLREVPDPHFNGAFDEVYELVLASAKALLQKIRAEQRL